MFKNDIKIILIILSFVLLFSLCSCASFLISNGSEINNEENIPMFIEIESSENWKIVYHRDTKVMYSLSTGYRNHGCFTVLLNADGTPMIYEGQLYD